MSHEYMVEAEFSHYFRSRGATGHAYEPIVASGKNACTLHHIDNAAEVKNNALLLIDIGASVDGYPADITRTYAVGKPNDRQKAVYTAVETAHYQIIDLLKPGLKVKDYSDRVDEIMKKALDSLGLLKKESDYRRYFPHAVSHGLGIDVHDSLGGPEVFVAGMVLTVEPGIYIPEEGIGVRIEDDILITKTGHENLSAALPTSL
jgi:Xaa-Pro aminopeptidase